MVFLWCFWFVLLGLLNALALALLLKLVSRNVALAVACRPSELGTGAWKLTAHALSRAVPGAFGCRFCSQRGGKEKLEGSATLTRTSAENPATKSNVRMEW